MLEVGSKIWDELVWPKKRFTNQLGIQLVTLQRVTPVFQACLRYKDRLIPVDW